MERKEKLNIFLLLVTLLALVVLTVVLVTRGSPGSRAPIATPAPTEKVGPMYVEPERKVIGNLRWIPVYMNGIPSGGAYMNTAKSKVYIDLEDFCLLMALSYEYTPGVEASIEGVPLETSFDNRVLEIKGRCFYMEGGLVRLYDRDLYPIRELCSIIGGEVDWDGERLTLSPQWTGIEEGDEEFYGEDDLLWLSHIINAESRNQPLEGMIAVGNVVMNRTKSGVYPTTIEGVVFDTNYGVQFTPVQSGSIYNEPSEDAVVAAKICLEGYNLVPDCLYFVNNELANESWFTTNRTFVEAIGDHDFYA